MLRPLVGRRLLRTAIALTVVAMASVQVAGQMPDLRQMAGQPLPSGDLPTGTVSVRVVRGGLSNNVAGGDVELIAEEPRGSPPAARVATDGNGRAVFSGLAVGTTFRAVVTVDGERLVSQPFSVPSSGGVRILLAAGLGRGTAGTERPPGGETATGGDSARAAEGLADAPAPTPAKPGSVTLGSQSRVVFELAERSVEVFCLLDILNPSAGPVTLSSPLVFELPDGAVNASVLEGSTPLGRAEGTRVTVAGPLPAGMTSLQFAYRLPTSGPTLAVRQPLPIEAPQGTVIVRKFGDLTISLAGESGRREVPIEGRTYIVLNGGPIAAGGTLDVTLSGLPAHARWPRYLALGLAALIAGLGAWLATSTPAAADEEGKRLRSERAARFAELVALERSLVEETAPGSERLQRRGQLIDEIVELDLALDASRPGLPHPPTAESNEPVAAGARTSAAQ